MTLEELIDQIASNVARVQITFQHNVIGQRSWTAQITKRGSFDKVLAVDEKSGARALEKAINLWKDSIGEST